MMGETPHPLLSTNEPSYTATLVKAVMPCMDTTINVLTVDQMIAGRSTKGLPLLPRLGLLLPPP